MDNKVLYIGGGLLAAYLLTRSTATATTTSTPNLLSSLLSSTPTTYTDATGHTVTVQPTASQNAGLTNPGYQMNATELNAYYNNYPDLQQGMTAGGWVSKYGSLNAALQQHWAQAGCTEHRTFLPLYVKSTTQYVPPPSGGGSSFLSSALSAVTTYGPSLLALAGIGSVANFTNGDIKLIVSGSAVAKQVLPMFGINNVTLEIEQRMNDTLSKLL
jgi:hypothetical protein